MPRTTASGSTPSRHVHPEVARALGAGRAVVALETAIVAHGLPRPGNLEVARQLEAAVRSEGAVAATIGMVAGCLRVGLDESELVHLATAPGVAKLADRDLAPAAIAGADGATSVSATLAAAAAAGIGIAATGGIGGVHRGAATSWDVSADLEALRRYPVLVVAAGVKSVLDVAATLERLETLGVPVVGYGSRRLAGFLVTDGGVDLDWSVSSPAEAAELWGAHRSARADPGGLLVSNALDPADQLDPAIHARTLAAAWAELEARGIRGKPATPFLLAELERATGRASVAANRTLAVANARLAARIAVAAAR